MGVVDLDVGCSFVFEVPHETHAVMLFEPHSTEQSVVTSSVLQIVSDGVTVPSTVYVDTFGNRCRRVTLSPGRVGIRFTARAEVSDAIDDTDEDAPFIPPADLPAEVLEYLLPSRYIESDQLADHAWATFGGSRQGWEMAQAVSDWVHDTLAFEYGSSSPSRSAVAVLELGIGVCRDFAHLFVGLCRSLNLPTRYVFGYLPDIDVPDLGAPMDFCAWCEVFLGGRWYTFDPRNNQRRKGRVVIGRGRDAADVAMITSFGTILLTEMTVRAEPGSGASWDAPFTNAPLTVLDVPT